MLQVRQRRAARLAVAAALAALALVAGGCSTTGLSFRQDDRVDIVAPRDRATVRLPFEVRWTVEDFHVAGDDGGSFGVLVDRAPPRPGNDLASLIDEPGCRREDGCPDESFLAERNIFRTTATSHRVERLAQTGPDGRRERHEITIILLDRNGRRIGESAFSVELELDRRTPSGP